MKVNEIFYSLQGEGHYVGTPAVFVRLSGCNLDCDFCDTQHHDGAEMSEDEIVAAVTRFPSRHVVITGGEPVLQLTSGLVESLHFHGRYVQIETNGTRRLGSQLLSLIDWITCSPKFGAEPVIERVDELKVVFDVCHPEYVTKIEAIRNTLTDVCYLQPCDCGNDDGTRRNIAACIEYIRQNPVWRLSLQTHKMLGIR